MTTTDTDFASRYESACRRDGTLRAARVIEVIYSRSGSCAIDPMPHSLYFDSTMVPAVGRMEAHPAGWSWREDEGRVNSCGFHCADHDAIAHATVAMIEWLAKGGHNPAIDKPERGRWLIDFERKRTGLSPDSEQVFEDSLHGCLLAAVEKVLESRKVV